MSSSLDELKFVVVDPTGDASSVEMHSLPSSLSSSSSLQTPSTPTLTSASASASTSTSTSPTTETSTMTAAAAASAATNTASSPKPPPRRQDSPYRKLVECTVCLQVTRTNVLFVCPSSHNICERCYDTMRRKRCPQTDCGAKYDSPPRRNTTAEMLVREGGDSFPFRCRHRCGVRDSLGRLEAHERACVQRPEVCRHRGCGEVMPVSEVPAHERDRHAACAFKGAGCPTVMVPPSMGTEWLSRHQRECGYRTVPCPLTTCEERVKERNILSHLRENHEKAVFEAEKMGNFETAWLFKGVGVGDAWHPFVLRFNRDVFFLNLRRDAGSGGGDYFAWVSMLAGEDAARKRKAKIKVKTGPGSNIQKSHTIKAEVYPVDVAADEIIVGDGNEGGCVLRLTARQVAECLGEVDGQLKLRIAVKIDFPDLLDATTADYSEAQPPSSPCGVA